jgi:inorganic pyrophosphatase
MIRYLPFLLLALLCTNCETAPDYESIPAREGEAIHVVVEIPAGTNVKIEYDKNARQFRPDQIDGQDRVIQFLCYPGNYGFIPSTLMDEARGGDGDALDVLVLGPAQPTGSVVKALPVGALMLRDRGEIDTKIIAVPLLEDDRVMPVDEFQDLLLDYDPVRRIVEEWFTHYKGFQQVEFLGWEDEKYAWKEVEKWEVE